MTKKFERITLVTCIETYGSKLAPALSALDELIPMISKHCSSVILLDYDHEGDYELVKQEG